MTGRLGYGGLGHLRLGTDDASTPVRVAQDVVEVIVATTSQQAVVAQDAVEVIVALTSQRARIYQAPVEVIETAPSSAYLYQAPVEVIESGPSNVIVGQVAAEVVYTPLPRWREKVANAGASHAWLLSDTGAIADDFIGDMDGDYVGSVTREVEGPRAVQSSVGAAFPAADGYVEFPEFSMWDTPSLTGSVYWIWDRYWSGSVDIIPIYFRKTFTVTGLSNVESALLRLNVDSGATVWVNGEYVASTTGVATSYLLNLTPYLVEGANVLAIRATTEGTSAGLLASAMLHFAGGIHQSFVSDNGWKATRTYTAGWNTVAFSETGWTTAYCQATYGGSPWGTVSAPTASTGGLPTGSNPRTVEAWVKTTSTDPTTVISYGSDQPSGRFTLLLNGETDIAVSTYDLEMGIDTDIDLVDGEWHNVAVSYDQSPGGTTIPLVFPGWSANGDRNRITPMFAPVSGSYLVIKIVDFDARTTDIGYMRSDNADNHSLEISGPGVYTLQLGSFSPGTEYFVYSYSGAYRADLAGSGALYCATEERTLTFYADGQSLGTAVYPTTLPTAVPAAVGFYGDECDTVTPDAAWYTRGITEPLLVNYDYRQDSSDQSSFPLYKPNRVADGDLLIVSIHLKGKSPAASTITPPAGWTLEDTHDYPPTPSGGLIYRAAIYSKVASSEGSTYTWGLSPATAYTASLSAFRNVSGVVDIVHHESTAIDGLAETGTVTTSGKGILFAAFQHSIYTGSSPYWSTPDGWTEIVDHGSGYYVQQEVCYKVVDSNEVVGPFGATLTSSTPTYFTSSTPHGAYLLLLGPHVPVSPITGDGAQYNNIVLDYRGDSFLRAFTDTGNDFELFAHIKGLANGSGYVGLCALDSTGKGISLYQWLSYSLYLDHITNYQYTFTTVGTTAVTIGDHWLNIKRVSGTWYGRGSNNGTSWSAWTTGITSNGAAITQIGILRATGTSGVYTVSLERLAYYGVSSPITGTSGASIGALADGSQGFDGDLYGVAVYPYPISLGAHIDHYAGDGYFSAEANFATSAVLDGSVVPFRLLFRAGYAAAASMPTVSSSIWEGFTIDPGYELTATLGGQPVIVVPAGGFSADTTFDALPVYQSPYAAYFTDSPFVAEDMLGWDLPHYGEEQRVEQDITAFTLDAPDTSSEWAAYGPEKSAWAIANITGDTPFVFTTEGTEFPTGIAIWNSGLSEVVTYTPSGEAPPTPVLAADDWATAVDWFPSLVVGIATAASIDPTTLSDTALSPVFAGSGRYCAWVKVVIPAGGTLTAQIDTISSGYDTVLSVYRDTVASVWTGDDDSGGSGTSKISSITMAAGRTYYILASSYYATVPVNPLWVRITPTLKTTSATLAKSMAVGGPLVRPEHVSNPSCETDTTGWTADYTGSPFYPGFPYLVTDPLQPQATFSRVVGDGPEGVSTTCLEAVFDTTWNQPVMYEIADSNFIGATYEATVWLKRISGSAVQWTVGRSMTDRSTPSGVTVPTSWTKYTFNWTSAADGGGVWFALANWGTSAATIRLAGLSVRRYWPTSAGATEATLTGTLPEGKYFVEVVKIREEPMP